MGSKDHSHSKKPTQVQQRQKVIDGKGVIEIRVKNALQLFDARDPAPFRDKDLDDDFVEYILVSVKELRSADALKLHIQVEESEGSELTTAVIRAAIKDFFTYKIELTRTELKDFLKNAQVILVIGFIFLFICLGIAQTLKNPESPKWIEILREGLVIFGWVSMWKPIELILFDWLPLYKKLQAYRKVEASEISLHFSHK